MMFDPNFPDFLGAYGYQFIVILCIVCAIVALGLRAGAGTIAYFMAKSRGLRTVPAFFAGFFASFIALFFIALFPKKNPVETQGTVTAPPPPA